MADIKLNTRFFLAILGALLSSTTIISLIQNWYSIELYSVPKIYIEFYRSITEVLFNWIPLPFGWSFSQFHQDSIVLNMFGILLAKRAGWVVGGPIIGNGLQAPLYNNQVRISSIPLYLAASLIPILPFVLIILTPTLFSWHHGPMRGFEYKGIARMIHILMLSAFVASVVFFLFNGWSGDMVQTSQG